MNHPDTIALPPIFDDMFAPWETPWWQQPWCWGLGVLILIGIVWVALVVARWVKQKKKRSLVQRSLELWLSGEMVRLAPKAFYEQVTLTIKQLLGVRTQSQLEAFTEHEIMLAVSDSELPVSQFSLIKELIQRSMDAKYAQYKVEEEKIWQDNEQMILLLRYAVDQEKIKKSP